MVRSVFLILALTCGGCLAAKYGQLALPFENCDGSGTFVSRGSGFNMLVSKDGAAFALPGKPGAVIHMSLVDSNPEARASGEEALSSHANYLIGGNPAAWRTGVVQFGRVRVGEILPHTDIVYYGGP